MNSLLACLCVCVCVCGESSIRVRLMESCGVEATIPDFISFFLLLVRKMLLTRDNEC